MKTITGQEIKVSANKSERTFTIRTNGSKYRTCKLSREEFESLNNATGNDWKSFLNYSQEYYTIN